VLEVEDPVGPNELAQFDKQVACKRHVAAEVLGLADEAEQSLRVTSREGRHGHSRYADSRMDSTRRPGEAWVADKSAKAAVGEPSRATRPRCRHASVSTVLCQARIRLVPRRNDVLADAAFDVDRAEEARDCSRPGLHAELGVDVLEMLGDRTRGEPE
jgi:hypothetical protein